VHCRKRDDLVARVAAGADEHGEKRDDDAVRRDELLEVCEDERRAALEEKQCEEEGDASAERGEKPAPTWRALGALGAPTEEIDLAQPTPDGWLGELRLGVPLR